ncbi:hypothetical protein M0813_30057 [Anaeramoeba flamelloides]|uniref:Uncharacterized protein n=1 Tax=Anaeramoeba flamelloides TaxID=1746091 RepID=A0ABQ8XPS3_9EUKA|nr:hypothetical protein M0813_30057 [Anaeramoeba flamelloides]
MIWKDRSALHGRLCNEVFDGFPDEPYDYTLSQIAGHKPVPCWAITAARGLLREQIQEVITNCLISSAGQTENL